MQCANMAQGHDINQHAENCELITSVLLREGIVWELPIVAEICVCVASTTLCDECRVLYNRAVDVL